jgi:hypothetical protein
LENGEGSASAPSAQNGAKSLGDLGIAWRVLGVQPVGFGSVAWVAISPNLPSITTCGAPNNERSAVRALRFGETGQVPEIEVENLSDGPILIPAHLVVTGGWQTRAVERSVVVPARSSARVPVKCVEAGRWAPRDEKSAGTFEVSDRTAMRTRWSTSLSMLEQLQRHGRFAAEQSTVWQHVEEELSRSPEPSHTRSYEAYLRGVKRQHREAVRKAKIAPPREANAVVLFPRGGGFWIEAYATPEALVEQADDLLADLFDSATRSETELGHPPSIEALLRMLWALPLRPVERVAGTLGSAYALACRFELRAGEPQLLEASHEAGSSTCETTGAVLAVDAGVAHLSVGGAPPRLIAKAGEARIASAVAAVAASGAGDVDRSGQLSFAGQAADAPAIREDGAPNDLGSARGDVLSSGAGRIPAVHEEGGGSPDRPGVAPMPSVLDSGVRGEPSRGRDRPPSAGSGLGISSQERSSFGSLGSGPRVPFPRAEIPIAQERPKIGRDVMRTIYARARDLLPFDPPPREDTQGYRLMRVLEGNVSWVDIRIGGDGYAVLGSHDRCDLVLASDAGIWLRHMIAICVRLEDNSVGLRLIDLKTDIPFFLEDDVPQWSVTASGPFAIRIGRHVVCGFPIGPGFEEAVAEPQVHAAARAHTFDSLSRSHAAVLETSAIDASVQLMRPLRHRDEPFTIVPSAPVSQIQELVGPSASPNHVRVTLERGGMGASVEIPADSLDTGVLLGRALNCFDGGLRRIFCDAVSRAHVLLLRDREEVHAIDLCTTNGTRVAGRRIRRYRLSNDGSTLELGKKVVFRWHRRRLLDPPPAPGDRGGSNPEQPGEIRRDAGESGSHPSK